MVLHSQIDVRRNRAKISLAERDQLRGAVPSDGDRDLAREEDADFGLFGRLWGDRASENGRNNGDGRWSVHERAERGHAAAELKVHWDIVAEGVDLDGWDEEL